MDEGMKYVSLAAFILAIAYPLSAFSASAGAASKIKIRKHSYLTPGVSGEEDGYASEKLGLLGAKRIQLIAEIRRFIANAKDVQQKTELQIRLGGLFMEEYSARLTRAQESYERAAEAFRAKKRGAREPKLENGDAMAYLEKAASLYRDLLVRFPSHPRRQEMLYALAVASQDRGRPDETVALMEQVLSAGTNPRMVNQALVQIGDYHFERNDFVLAKSYYLRIINARYAPLLSYTVFKRAWCAYHTGRSPMALQSLKWVVEHERRAKGSKSVNVKTEALRDLALVFVDLKLLDESVAFYEQQEAAELRHGLETMATLYFEKTDHAHAISLWDRLLALDALNVKNPSYELGIVSSLDLSGRGPAGMKRLVERLPLYLAATKWRSRNAKDAGIREAIDGLEEATRKYALRYHADAQKLKNEASYGAAKSLYAEYLKWFPEMPQASTLRFNLAEIQYHEGELLPAADSYYTVYRSKSAGNLRLEAIRGALLSLDRGLNEERRKAGLGEISAKSSGKLVDAGAEKIAYSGIETRFLGVSGEFLKNYPGEKEAADVLYERAYLAYSHRDFVPALSGFNEVVTRHAGHPVSYGSAHLVLDILNRTDDLGKLIAVGQGYQRNAAMSRPEFRTELGDILRKAELKSVQLAEKDNRFKDAAEGYFAYARAHGPEDEALFEKALYNAAVDYAKADLPAKAAEAEDYFLRRFPRSTYRREMLLQAAKTYASLARFERAAANYEAFAKEFPAHPEAGAAMRLAGLYHWGSGDASRAEAIMLDHQDRFPADRPDVERDLLALYASRGMSDRELRYYEKERSRRGVPAWAYLDYTVRMAELEARNPKARARTVADAQRLARRSSDEISKKPQGAEALAHLAFSEAQWREAAFDRMRLATTKKDLGTVLQRKLSLLKELDGEYTKIARLGSPEWGLGAMYRTASLYTRMAADVAAAPVPTELDAKGLEGYRAEITKQLIKPFREKAAALAKGCLAAADDGGILSGWTPKCHGLAAELDPEHFSNVRTFHMPPVQTALVIPKKESTRFAVGKFRSYPAPYYSSKLFEKVAEQGAANFAPLSRVRLAELRKRLDSEKPEGRQAPTLSYLNLLRIFDPRFAVRTISTALESDASNPALHNLLGLAYLDAGDMPAAKVTWLSMVANGVKDAAVWNNLGVVSSLMGREAEAMEYFTAALSGESPREASSNLGSLALKYRAGARAKKYFEKTLDLDSEDWLARTGYAVACLQSGDAGKAGEKLGDAVKQGADDPYARLSLSYLLIDGEKNTSGAFQLVSEYLERHPGESPALERALQETKGSIRAGDKLVAAGAAE